MGDFPGGPVVKSLRVNAGNKGLIPTLGRSQMPRGNWAPVPQLVSLHTQLLKASHSRVMLRNKISHRDEKPTHHN